MNEIREIRATRGIQEADVWTAATGCCPRGCGRRSSAWQRLGRGSPNTVSPMIERWFASLGSRVAGGAAPPAGNDADGVPVSVRNATRLLWETARREAEQVQEPVLETVRGELRVREEALALLDLVDGRLHVVVDAPARETAQRRK